MKARRDLKLKEDLEAIVQAYSVEAEEAAAERVLSRHLRVLVVEDNPVNQSVARKLLDRLGYQADVAGNGRAALEAIGRLSYDLVFMDVQMPELDGCAATRAIRARELEKQPCIIAMTANTQQSDRDACKEAGMDAFVAKPVSLSSLEEVIERVQRYREVG